MSTSRRKSRRPSSASMSSRAAASCSRAGAPRSSRSSVWWSGRCGRSARGPGTHSRARPASHRDRARRHAGRARRLLRSRRSRLLGPTEAQRMIGDIDTPPSILDAHGSEAHHLANVWWIMLGIAAFVYLVVGGFIVLASLRGRRREPAEGPSRHDQWFIWIGGVIVPTVILMFVAFLTVHTGAA